MTAPDMAQLCATDPDVRFAMCPRCDRPLRFDTRGEGPDRYLCTNARCSFESTRDGIVETLIRQLHQRDDLLERYARLSLQGVVRDLYTDQRGCEACEAKWREAVVAALGRADARAKKAE